MPAEISNPYPFPSAAEVDAAPGDRVAKAARNIAVRGFDGIPSRAFLLGQNDHSPVMRGIRDLVAQCYRALDEVAEDSNALPEHHKLLDMLHENGCR